MTMKKEEIDFLGLKKSKEGKNYIQIQEEIQNIKSFDKEIKKNSKKSEKDSKLIELLKERINRIEKELFDLRLIQKGSKEITPSTLNKIIAITNDEELPKGEIKALLSINDKEVTGALTFLIRHNIITETKRDGMNFYKNNKK